MRQCPSWFLASLIVVSAAHAEELAPLLLVVNKADSTVSFLDTVTLRAVAIVTVGHHPHEITVTPDGKTAIVANYGVGDSLSVIDIPARKEAGKIALGAHRDPHGVQASRDGRAVFVTCEANREVVEIGLRSPATAWTVQQVYPTDQETTHMLAIAADGRTLYAANLGGGTVSVIDRESKRSSPSIPTGAGCEGIDVTPDGTQVWTANKSADTLSVIDTASRKVIATLPCARRPIRVKFTPDGHRALVSCARSNAVAVWDVARRTEVARIPTGAAPIGLVIDPSGRRAYVADTEADRVSVIDLSTLRVIGTIATGHEPDGLALVPAGARGDGNE